MGARSETLATELEQEVANLANAVESCTEARWSALCKAEGWTVAQTAHHLSGGFPIEMEYVTAAAEGTPLPPYTWDDIDRITRDQADKAASISKAEVLNELRDGAPSTIAYIRALTDDQLDRTSTMVLADGATVTAQHIIERIVLIDHFRTHLESIRAAAL